MKPTIIYIDNFLTSHGHTPTTGITLVNLFRQDGYKVVASSYRKNKILRLIDMVATIIRHQKNAIVLIATYSTSAFYFALACARVCQLVNVPYISCLHGGNLPYRIRKSPNISKQIFSNSITNVAVSGYLGQTMKEHGWKSVTIPNSIDIDAYPFRHRNKCNPHLLWVRSFHEIYNPLLAIKIVKQLSVLYPGVSLTMVGPDKDGSLEKCKSLAISLGIESNIHFTGRLKRDEWVELSAKHDIFINTTRFDNLPVSVIEAMALGLLVISTNVGGIPFLIDDQHNGLLVPDDDAGAFVLAIQSVLNNESLASTLCLAARETATKYDWKFVREQWHTLLQSVPLAQ